MGEATAGALLDDVAIAWLKHEGSYVVDPQMKERLAAYRGARRSEERRNGSQ